MPAEEHDSGKPGKLRAQHALYKALLEKYADIINEKERRTVGEIKRFVNKDNLTIQSVITEVRPKNYDYGENYREAAEKVFSFVCREITFVESGISLNFWLTPEEIFSLRIADDEDLAVLLCSLLYGLGDEQAAVVIVELSNLTTHAFVMTEIRGMQYILDPAQAHAFTAFSGNREECISKYRCNGVTIKQLLYKFNRANYEQFL